MTYSLQRLELNLTQLYMFQGNWNSKVNQQFLDKNVMIDVDCVYADATAVQRIILAGIQTPDVFVLDVDDGFWALVQKQYLEEIVDQSFIDEVSRFYPAIQKVLRNNQNQLVAMPEYFMPIHWCINETMWNQVFGATPYPATFLELAELFTKWKEEFSAEYPEIKLLEFSGDSEKLILDVINQYISQCEISHQPLVFQDEVLIQTLELLRDLDLQRIMDSDEDSYFNQQALLTMYPMGGFSVEYSDGCRYIPLLPPRLTSDSPAYVPARMRVMFVNPNSRNKELAYSYLWEHWNTQSAKVKAAIVNNWNTVVFSETGMEKAEQINQEIKDIQIALEKAIKENNLSQIDLLNKRLIVCYEQREKILDEFCDVSQEDIEAYRMIGPSVNILFGSPYSHEEDHAMQSIGMIIKQFADGKMSGTICAQKLTNIAQMVNKERNSSSASVK